MQLANKFYQKILAVNKNKPLSLGVAQKRMLFIYSIDGDRVALSAAAFNRRFYQYRHTFCASICCTTKKLRFSTFALEWWKASNWLKSFEFYRPLTHTYL